MYAIVRRNTFEKSEPGDFLLHLSTLQYTSVHISTHQYTSVRTSTHQCTPFFVDQRLWTSRASFKTCFQMPFTNLSEKSPYPNINLPLLCQIWIRALWTIRVDIKTSFRKCGLKKEYACMQYSEEMHLRNQNLEISYFVCVYILTRKYESQPFDHSS